MLRRSSGVLWALARRRRPSAILGHGRGRAQSARLLEPVLALFKVAPTRVGGELRVSASFQYATIAAMYFEMVAPLAIILARNRSTAPGATARRARSPCVCTASVVLSLTRAGMLTLAVVYAALIVVGCAWAALRGVLAPRLAERGGLAGWRELAADP